MGGIVDASSPIALEETPYKPHQCEQVQTYPKLKEFPNKCNFDHLVNKHSYITVLVIEQCCSQQRNRYKSGNSLSLKILVGKNPQNKTIY